MIPHSLMNRLQLMLRQVVRTCQSRVAQGDIVDHDQDCESPTTAALSVQEIE